MCGIVGAVAGSNVTNVVLNCLKRLEYRGYDSAGMAAIDSAGSLRCVKAVGKLERLVSEVRLLGLKGNTCVAHTRWATHGMPTKANAHPQVSHNTVAVVHNGIIENHEQLRTKLMKRGFKFSSDTDTEVIAHLIYDYHINQKLDGLVAVQQAVSELVGSYAIAVVCSSDPQRIIVVKFGSPAVIGVGEHENYVASDAIALLPVTNKFIYLENGDIAVIEQTKFKIYNAQLKEVHRPLKISEMALDTIEKGDYAHFMLKEIFEQPRALADTLGEQLFDGVMPASLFGNNAADIFGKTRRILITACGSSYHAALVSKYWLERYAQINCQVEIASEFCYREVVVEPDTLFVTISQSGETADTIAALTKAKRLPFISYLTICNVPGSSLVRASELVFLTRAGIEIGVATTKAFTAQLLALFMLTISVGESRGLAQKEAGALVAQARQVPDLAKQVLKLEKQIVELANLLQSSRSIFYLGRGCGYPIALEGALKIKEISYIHAEGYPSGELKHGPLALIDKESVVVALITRDSLYEKTLSNLHEVSVRGGRLIIFAPKGLLKKRYDNWHICTLPDIPEGITPILYTIPLQLLAYHVALLRGTDIDQPRNLAKSVTVE